jgi:hypothetical protein
MNFQQKYLKYKNKYLQLKGGFHCPPEARNGEDHAFNNENENERCPICYGENTDIKFIPCCHLICHECYERIRRDRPGRFICPECRTPITEVFVKEQMQNNGVIVPMWLNLQRANVLVDQLDLMIHSPEFRDYHPDRNYQPIHRHIRDKIVEIFNNPLARRIARKQRGYKLSQFFSKDYKGDFDKMLVEMWGFFN